MVIKPAHVKIMKPLAKIVAVTSGSLLSSYFGPLGFYAGEVLSDILGDVVSDIFEDIGLAKIENLEEEKIRKKFEEDLGIDGLKAIFLEAFDNTLGELKKEYVKKYGNFSRFKLNKPSDLDWFECIRKRMIEGARHNNLPVDATDLINDTIIYNFLFSFGCEPNDELRELIKKNFLRIFKENLIKAVNMNSWFRIKFDMAILETISKQREELRKYINALVTVANLSIEGIEKQTRDYLSYLLTKDFVGRDEMLQMVEHVILSSNSGKIIITGTAGVGKSTFMAHLVDKLSRNREIIVIPYFFDISRGRRDFKTALRYILAKLYLVTFHEKPPDPIIALDEKTLVNTIFGILAKSPPRKVVILLDAIDEIDQTELASIGYPFPRRLPDNVYLIFSVRGNKNYLEIPGHSKMIKDWIHGSEIFELNNLNYDSIALLVREKLGLDEENVVDYVSKTIYLKTMGNPLYLGFLLEELSTLDINTIIKRIQEIPASLEEYIDSELVVMETTFKDPELIDSLFALLSILREPISINEIEDILGVSRRTLKRIPSIVKRWILVQKADHIEKWYLQHEILKPIFSSILEEYVSKVTMQLLDYCKHNFGNSKYCVNYYPQHLYDSERYPELVELGKNDGFISLQIQENNGNIYRAIRTLELSMDSAVKYGNIEDLILLGIKYLEIYNNVEISLIEYYAKYGLNATMEVIARLPYMITKFQAYILLAQLSLLEGDSGQALNILHFALSFAPSNRKEEIKLLIHIWDKLEDDAKLLFLVNFQKPGFEDRYKLLTKFGATYSEDILKAVRDFDDYYKLIKYSLVLIPVLVEAGEINRVSRLLNKYASLSIRIRDPYKRAMISLELIKLFMSIGRIRDAAKLCDSTFDILDKLNDVQKVKISLTLAKLCHELNNHDQVFRLVMGSLDIANAVMDPLKRSELLLNVSHVLTYIGHHRDAYKTFKQVLIELKMISESKNIDKKQLEIQMEKIISDLLKNLSCSEIVDLFEYIKSIFDQSQFLKLIDIFIHAMLRNRCYNDAKLVLRMYIRDSKLIADPYTRCINLIKSSYYAKSLGLSGLSNRLVKLSLDSLYKINNPVQCIRCLEEVFEYITVVLNSKDVASLLEFCAKKAETITESYEKVRSIIRISKLYLVVGTKNVVVPSEDDIITWALSERNVHRKISLLLDISEYLILSNRNEVAQNLLNLTINLAKDIANLDFRVKILKRIGLNLIMAGDYERAKKILATNLESLLSSGSYYKRAVLLGSIAEVLASFGYKREAEIYVKKSFYTVDMIWDKSLKTLAIAFLANNFLKNNISVAPYRLENIISQAKYDYNNDFKVYILPEIIRLMLQSGYSPRDVYKEGISFVNSIDDSYQKAITCAKFAEIFYGRNLRHYSLKFIHKSLRHLNKVRDPYQNLNVILTLSRIPIFIEIEKKSMSTLMFSWIKRASSIQNPYLRAKILVSLGHSTIEYGHEEMLYDILLEIIDSIAKIEIISQKTEVVSKLIHLVTQSTSYSHFSKVDIFIRNEVSKIEDPYLKLEFLIYLMKGLAKFGLEDSLRNNIRLVLIEIDNLKDTYKKIELLSRMLSPLLLSGLFDILLEVQDKIIQEYRKNISVPETYLLLKLSLSLALKEGLISWRDIFSALENTSSLLQTSVLSSLLSVELFGHNIAHEEILYFIEEINKAIDKIPDLYHRAEVIIKVASLIYNLKNKEYAISFLKASENEVFYNIQEPYKAVKALVKLSNAYILFGSENDAVRVLSFALEKVNYINALYAKCVALERIIRAYRKLDAINKVLYLIEYTSSCSFNVPNPIKLIKVRINLSKVLKEIGHLDKAERILLDSLEYVQQLTDDYKRVTCYVLLSNGFLEISEKMSREVVNLALNELDKIKLPTYRVPLLLDLSKVLISLNDIKQARELLQEANYLLRKVRGYSKQAKVGISLARLFEKINMNIQAEKVIKDITNLSIRNIAGPYEQDEILTVLVEYFVDKGNIDSAIKVIQSIKSPKYRIHALEKVLNNVDIRNLTMMSILIQKSIKKLKFSESLIVLLAIILKSGYTNVPSQNIMRLISLIDIPQPLKTNPRNSTD